MGSEIIVGVGAVVLYGTSEIVLVKRGNPPCKGCWAIPGGRVEYGESIADAVKRELYEETGLKAEPLGILWVSEVFPSETCETKEHFIIVDFLMKPCERRKPVPGSDVVDAGIFNIYNPPHPLSHSTKKLLKHIYSLVEKNNLLEKIIPWG